MNSGQSSQSPGEEDLCPEGGSGRHTTQSQLIAPKEQWTAMTFFSL